MSSCGERTQSTGMPCGESRSSTASRMDGWSSAARTRIDAFLLLMVRLRSTRFRYAVDRVGHRDAVALEDGAGGASNLDDVFFVLGLGGNQRRLGDGQVVVG